MKLGSSATPTGNLEADYPAQVRDDHVKGCYYYGQATPTWSGVDSIPSTHAIAFQHKGSTRSAYDATLQTFPVSRSAYVMLHPVNEIDRHVKEGVLSLAQASAQIDAIVAAVKAAGKSYVRPAVGLMYWSLYNYLKGDLGPNNAWDWSAYIRPGVKKLIISVYANGHESGGDWTPNGPVEDPVAIAANIDKVLDQHSGVTWEAVFGYPIPPDYMPGGAHYDNGASLNDRVAWLQKSFDTYKAMKHPPSHMLWFDQNWSALGDERLAEPNLHAKWVELAESVGQ